MFRLSARFSEGAEKVTDLFWDEVHNHHRRKYAEHLEDPLHDLTQAFVSELNKHAGAVRPGIFSGVTVRRLEHP